MITVCPKFTLTSTPESLSPELCLTTYKLLSRPKIWLQISVQRPGWATRGRPKSSQKKVLPNLIV